MDRLIEFASNHYVLVACFAALWVLFFMLEATRGGKGVSPQAATNMVNQQEALIIDVRPADEFRAGHIAGSRNIPSDQIGDRIGELEGYREKPLIFTCDTGSQASHAGRQLLAKGFKQVYRIQGGVAAWRNDNLPVVKT